MAQMIMATWEVAAVDLGCPFCHESIPAPHGSLFWTIDEMNVTLAAGVVECECGKILKVPRKIPGYQD